MASTTTVVEYGYIFCLSSEPLNMKPYREGETGVFYVGWTTKDLMTTIEEMENNAGSPREFTLEFAKKVKSPARKSETVRDTLDDYDTRIYEMFDFFECKISQIKQIFNIFDGTWFVEP